MKKLYTLVLLASWVGAMAQSSPGYTNFFLNRMWHNPAAAGSYNRVNAALFARYEAIGINGAPFNVLFTGDIPLKESKSSLGLSVRGEAANAFSSATVKLAYAYRLKLPVGQLAFGVDLGYFNNVVNADGINFGRNYADVAFGMYYNTKKFYLGFSATELFNGRAEINNAFNTSPDSRRLWAMGGVNFNINETIELRPAFLATLPYEKLQNPRNPWLSINLSGMVKERWWVGLGYRSNDVISLNLGANVWKYIRIGLAYDIITRQNAGLGNGAAEGVINYLGAER